MKNCKFYFFLLIKNIILSIIIFFFFAPIVVFFIMKIFYISDISWGDVFDSSDQKKILIGGIIAGIAGWLQFIFNHKHSTKLGKKAVEILNKQGYQTEINEISPDIKIPFYKIDGELFYNYATYTKSMEFMLSGIKKITKRANPKNLVINMAEVSIKLDKLEKKILKKFGNKLDKILIIDKSGNVIKLK
ncbi:hypothetical protein PT276_06930 [Orbaceae bacterium ESL0721]|nr:hypothetical protein [Orbaceae bacterium ESL0721]